MNQTLDRKGTRWIELGIVFLMGLIVFQQKFGWFVLNPFHYDWMLIRGSDVNPDFLVWAFFYQSPWTFPLGMVEGYAHPLDFSIVATSSLSLLAIPMKAIGELLGMELFQFFGPWILLCCLLQGAFGWAIMKSIGIKNPVTRLAGAGFFLLAPCFLDRRFHISLFGHWVLLMAIWLYFEGRNKGNRFFQFAWWGHAVLAILIHPYYLVFSVGLALAYWWTTFKDRRLLKTAGMFFGQVAITACTLFVFGYFHTIKEAGRAKGFGFYSANLNTFFNNLGKTAAPLNLPVATNGQYEGFAYLGAGGLLLFVLAVYLFFRHAGLWSSFKERLRFHWPLVLVTIALFVFALSNNVTFFGMKAYIPLPERVLDAVSTFRSSGRFAWLSFYLIILAGLWVLERGNPNYRWTSSIVLFLFFIQIWDTFPQLKKDFKDANYVNPPMDIEAVQPALWASEMVLTYPPFKRSLQHPDDNMDLLLMASKKGIPITAGWIPRLGQGNKKFFFDRIHEAVETGHFDYFPKAVWIISPDQLPKFSTGSQDEGFRLFLHRGYGIGFGSQVEIPEDFIQSPEVDALYWRILHVSDWLKEHPAAYTLLAVKDDASYGMDGVLKNYFKDNGSEVTVELGFRSGWVAIWGPQGLIAEQSGPATALSTLDHVFSTANGEVELKLESAGNVAGNYAKILVNGTDYAPNERGLNVVLLDENGVVMEAKSFDTFETSFIQEKQTGGQ